MSEPLFNVDIGGDLTIGPFDSKQLKQMARTGMIHAETRIEVVGRGWRAAGSIKGLPFASAPPSGAPISAPTAHPAPAFPSASPSLLTPAPVGAPMPSPAAPMPSTVAGSATNPYGLVRMEPIMVLLLMLFTCGVYPVIWTLRVAKNMNAIAGREVASPGLCAALTLCCGIGWGLLFMGVSKTLPDIGRALGREQEFASKSGLLIALGFLFPIVPIFWVQSWINALHDRRATA